MGVDHVGVSAGEFQAEGIAGTKTASPRVLQEQQSACYGCRCAAGEEVRDAGPQGTLLAVTR